MPKNHFSRKERQLKNHIYNLENLLKISNGIISKEINILISKIKNLVSLLKGNISINKLKHIVGSFAILFGLSTTNHINAQSFTTPVQNPFGLTFSSIDPDYFYGGKLQFADMDDDGDLDLLYSSLDVDTSYYSYYVDNIFMYHENVGNSVNPQFSIGAKNPFNLSSPQNFTLYNSILSHNLVDLDNDGDLDILATYTGIYPGTYSYPYGYNIEPNTVFKYYENIGNPSIPLFAAQQTNPFGLVSDSIISFCDVIDIDGDGDYDIITTNSGFDNTGYGYLYSDPTLFIENTGTPNNPQFATPQINQQLGITTPTSEYLHIPSFGDIDGDGDFDLLSIRYDINHFSFYYQQNKGSATNPLLSLEAKNPFGLTSFYSGYSDLSNPEMVDLDGDGDFDIITSSLITYNYGLGYYNNDHIYIHYFENTSAQTNTINIDKEVKLYPNPVSDILKIESKNYINKIEIIDQLGRVIVSEKYSKYLNVSYLSKGTYTITLYLDDKVISKKISKL